jgi:hypothetical protein
MRLQALDSSGKTLSLNGETLYLFYGDDGQGGMDETVLVAKTAGGDVGFTITLEPDANTYTIVEAGIISNGVLP